MRNAAAYAVAAATLAAACGPIPVERAEAFCAEQAAPPKLVSGRVAMGAGKGGARGRATVLVAPTVGWGDPSARYNTCVFQKSGQYPTRPLYDREASRG